MIAVVPTNWRVCVKIALTLSSRNLRVFILAVHSGLIHVLPTVYRVVGEVIIALFGGIELLFPRVQFYIFLTGGTAVGAKAQFVVVSRSGLDQNSLLLVGVVV